MFLYPYQLASLMKGEAILGQDAIGRDITIAPSESTKRILTTYSQTSLSLAQVLENYNPVDFKKGK